MLLSNPPVLIYQPADGLREYIAHYWLCLGNTHETYTILPDGSVDLVVTAGSRNYRIEVFGTTTTKTDLPLELSSHYLGIRFRPGQARHFLEVTAAELTDGYQPAAGIFLPDICAVAESMTDGNPFTRLDAILLRHLERLAPQDSLIDDVIRHINAVKGELRVAELADLYGKSRRQFERHFLDVVGISPKLFARIVRFQQATTLLARSPLSLAQISAELGYTDQSHLTHDFAHFYGQPPSRARKDAAFLQDAPQVPAHYKELRHS